MKNIFEIIFSHNSKQAGFTLIELLIVIVVLGILMSMAVPALSGVKNKADTAVAKADLHNVMQSLEMYYLDQGEYPLTADFTVANLENLNLKNELSTYSYTNSEDTSTGGEKYLVSYKAAEKEYYYIKSEAGSLMGPVETAPTL